MTDCDDLRLGGTLSASGITAGTSINSTALKVSDWSDLMGSPGMSAEILSVNGRSGGVVAGDRLGLPRFPTLNMEVTNRGPLSVLVEPTAEEQTQANTDQFLALVTNPAGNYLEVDLPDGTSRFLYVYNTQPALFRQPAARRTISVMLESEGSFWKEGGQESTDTITGADTITAGGNRNASDAILVFAGNGTFENTTAGWEIEVVGAAGAVTVNLGQRTVTEGGNPATNRIRRTSAEWGWFQPGSNTVTASVSVVVTWRSSWA